MEVENKLLMFVMKSFPRFLENKTQQKLQFESKANSSRIHECHSLNMTDDRERERRERKQR
ncbi:CLUMA_CG004947, isoform A [Clunio marinus]|uniref:CLUMA_CG004947, isoform A n=1 Tax=Clunio marinus TaxID=568069 RepID=A0A1J1HV93_9DIPT|nr:CLUMA_CG004947, isoform A [Clunio marinus]